MTRGASIVPSTLDDEARTVDVVWTTGARVMRGYYDRYWEQLSLDPKNVRMKRLNNGAPFLNDHNADGAQSVLGVVVEGSAAVDGKRGTATIRFARAGVDPIADQIYAKVKDGIVQNLSVGYQVYSMTKIADSADGIPVYEVDDWEPMEITVTPIGADDGAGFRSANNERTPCAIRTETRALKEKTKMSDETDTNPTTSADKLEDAIALAATEAARKKRLDDARVRAEVGAQAAEEATARERARIDGINDIAERSGLGAPWAGKLIKGGVSVEAARDAAFKFITKRQAEDGDIDGLIHDGVTRYSAGEDARDKYVRGAAAWLIERTGKRSVLELAKKRSPDLFRNIEFDGLGQFGGMSPVEIARDTLERAGIKTRGMDRMRMIGMAFTHRSGSFQTTSDFANILENVLHKLLLGSYATQDTTWQRFCATDQVPDFRTSNRYRTGSLSSLPKVAEHGEYTNGKIPDAAKYGITTERHGEIFSLSREAIVNDDMGALANLAMEFGRAAARTIENDVYALLAQNAGLGPTMSDSNPFYHSSRGNVGTGAAISVVSIDADRVLMRAQKDPAGLDYLMLTPTKLVLPDALQGTAAVINRSEYDPDTANKLQRRNMVFNLFDDIIGTPRLSSTSTRRYTFCDPNIAAAFVVAFLEGYGMGPIMESQQGWRVDGVEWKVTQYAKAQAADPKASVTNAGV